MTFARPVAGGGGSFDPLSLSPALWLSDTGSDPSAWSDLSGNARHATQATVAWQPAIVSAAINGKQVRRFDGGNDNFGFASAFMSGSSAGTAFYVYKAAFDPATTGSGAPLSGWGSSGSASHFPFTDGNVYEGFGTTSRKSCGNPTPSLTSPRIISNVSAANDWRLYIDGSLFFSTATNTVGWGATPSIGTASNSVNGDIAEVYILPYAATTTQRQDVESWLNTKYAIY
jgi:hypothetical protein